MEVNLSPHEGLFSFESLNVRLGFARERLDLARSEFLRTGRPPVELRAYVHELTHYVQSTTTPFGVFLHYCRQLQTADTIELVRALINAGLKVERPLLRRAPVEFDGPVGINAHGAVARWIGTELLAAFLGQNVEKFAHYAEALTSNSAKFTLLGQMTVFGRLQGGIAHFIETQNAGLHSMGLLPWDQGDFDVDAINADGDGFGSDYSRSLERSAVALELLGGNPWGTRSILESAAMAAEWAESGHTLESLREIAKDWSDPETADYRRCLERGFEVIQTDDVHQFCFTYVALSELALQAPLLPQHARLRNGSLDPRQLFPSLRFQFLLSAASDVAPLRGLADVGRYHTDLCAALGWVHPMQIQAIAQKAPANIGDRRVQRYLWAQQERAQRQHAFINLLQQDCDLTVEGEAFRARYIFPVIEYADKTLYMKDKDTLWWLTTQHLLTYTMRQVMLGKTLTVPCPYRGDPSEAETLTIWLREELESLFDRPFPMAQVISVN